MARPTKVGIPWFPLSVNVFDDEKFVAMNTDFGSVGELAILKLYCMIYDKGYYIKWEPLVRAAFVRKMSGEIDKVKADEIVDAAAEYGIFDQELFIAEKVLTCRHIQEVFANATTRRTGDLPTEFWLLDYSAGSKKGSGAECQDSGKIVGGEECQSPETPSKSPKIGEQLNQGDNYAEKPESLVIEDSNEVFASNNAAQPVVIASKSTQSRVEYSIVDNSKEEKKKKNTNKRDLKPTAFDPYVYEFSSFKSQGFIDAWRLFCDHRKAIKKPLSPAACDLINGQLSTETEAVAIELLHNTVSRGWTGVKSEWMRDEEKEKINKQAIYKEFRAMTSTNVVNIPKEVMEERLKRQQRYELFGSSTPHKLKAPDPFPLQLSVFHKVDGFPNDLRENVVEIIYRVNQLPTRADLANYSYNVPLHRYPHRTKYFKWAFEEWTKATEMGIASAWEKLPILCAYDEPVASQMLLDSASKKNSYFEEFLPDRFDRMRKWIEPLTEEDRVIRDNFYQENALAWVEFRRRQFLIQETKKNNPDFDLSNLEQLQWPDRVCTFHEEFGGIDRRKPDYSIAPPNLIPSQRRYLNDQVTETMSPKENKNSWI